MTLQEIFVEEMVVYPSKEPYRHEQRQRAIVILHQMIDDAHQGKRQFLSGNSIKPVGGLVSVLFCYPVFS